jgi:type I restriction enzyme, S subunit
VIYQKFLLDDLITMKGGGTPSKKIKEYWDGDIPWASVKDLTSTCLSKTQDYITKAGLENSNSNLIPEGSIILATRMAVGRVCINDFPVAINQDLRALFCSDKILSRYLLWFLLSSTHILENQASGATVKGITLDAIKNLEVPLPPLEEQKRIAAILDKADRVRRKRQEAIRLTEELGRSIFLDMFGDPVTNPKGWKTCKISKIASVHRGKFTPRPRNDPRFYNGNYPFIQTGDITSAKGYLTKYKQTLNEDGIKVSRSFNPGSIVIAIVGATIGETAILKSEMYCPDSVIGITPYDLRSSEYIEYSLRYWKQIFRDQAPQTARANINLETIRPLEIPCPPIELQEKFKFVYEWSFKNTNRAVYQESENLFNSLLQRAFRGEL